MLKYTQPRATFGPGIRHGIQTTARAERAETEAGPGEAGADAEIARIGKISLHAVSCSLRTNRALFVHIDAVTPYVIGAVRLRSGVGSFARARPDHMRRGSRYDVL